MTKQRLAQIREGRKRNLFGGALIENFQQKRDAAGD